MAGIQNNLSLEQRIAAITNQNIKADPNHLVESIRRQFPNPDEYSRELVTNGLDAGATNIQIKGDIWKEGDARYARLRFIDDGKGMSFADMLSYLTVFESHKDGKNQSVGKHGVGKLSPWADRDLAIYCVDTCDGRERTELRMTSVNDGVIKSFVGNHRGTVVSLLWKNENPLETLKQKLTAADKVIRSYCRYTTRPILIDLWNDACKRFIPHSVIVSPELEGWIPCGAIDVEGTPAAFHYRFGQESGVRLHQGGVFVVEKKSLYGWQWEIDKLGVMIDSHAFNLPISRNDVIEDSAYVRICLHLVGEILPSIIQKLCRQISNEQVWFHDLSPELAAGIVIDYLRLNQHFPLAQDLPLIPVLPFGRATVNQLRAARRRHGSLLLCKCGGDEFDGVTGHEVVIDENKVTSRMEKFLENHFGPFMRVNYNDEAIEAPADSSQAELSPLERRFQDSLVLLCSNAELERLSAEKASSEENDNDTGQGQSSGSEKRNTFGPLSQPDLPDIRFKLTRLVRLDGKTPVSTIKFKINGTAVFLNLNHPAIQSHLAFVAKDPDLAAHWCLRELILSDRIECFRHLNYDACEALVLHDAIGRCVEIESMVPRSNLDKGQAGKGYWNDDYLDWKTLLGD